MMQNWGKSLAEVLKSEGLFSDDPCDLGNRLPDGRPGCTNLGITQRAWELYTGRVVTHDEMRAITVPMAGTFYRTKYWYPIKGDALPTGVDYLTFDLAVNGGPARAAMTLQQALGITADGVIGMQTTNTASLADPVELVKKFSDVKRAFYKSLNNPTYERGWLNRTDATEATALAMLEAGATATSPQDHPSSE